VPSTDFPRLEATSILQILSIEYEVLKRQRARLDDLFGFNDTDPPLDDLGQCMDELRKRLERFILDRLRRGLRSSFERIWLNQMLCCLKFPSLGPSASTVSIFPVKMEDLRSSSVFEQVTRSGDWAGGLNILIHGITHSPNSITRFNLESLMSMGKTFVEAMQRIESVFRIEFPQVFKAPEIVIPPTLMCDSWQIDVRSDKFVDYSFLWCWIRSRLKGYLESNADISWLNHSMELVKTLSEQNLELHSLDHFGLSFFHTVALVRRWEHTPGILSVETATVPDGSGRNLSHYAAAIGDRGILQDVQSRGIKDRDKYDRTPIYYSDRNGHTNVSLFLKAKA
jgi:hypothetical protein